jgi:hypothetical protein
MGAVSTSRHTTDQPKPARGFEMGEWVTVPLGRTGATQTAPGRSPNQERHGEITSLLLTEERRRGSPASRARHQTHSESEVAHSSDGSGRGEVACSVGSGGGGVNRHLAGRGIVFRW